MSSAYNLQPTSYKLLKIGIVCYPTIGGSGVVATNLGWELAQLGHKVHFISYEKPFGLIRHHKNIFFHQVKFYSYPLFKYPDYTLPLAVKIEEVSRKFNLDLVHVHYAVPHATAALLARKMALRQNRKAPSIITTLHGTDITLMAADPSLKAIVKYSIEDSFGVTAVSQSLKQTTQKVTGTKKPIEVIYNFYTPKKITKTRESVRKGLKIKSDDFLAIHLSNLRPVKRIPDLLKIMAKVKKHPNIKLLILAGGDFAPYQEMVKKLGISKNVIVKSRVTDIENYINASDIGVYTSADESFGMGILETMSYGKPVLATNVGGVKEVMINQQTGFLFRTGDVNSFARKLLELSNKPETVKQLGSKASDIACEKFCSQTIVKQYLDYYYKILNKST